MIELTEEDRKRLAEALDAGNEQLVTKATFFKTIDRPPNRRERRRFEALQRRAKKGK